MCRRIRSLIEADLFNPPAPDTTASAMPSPAQLSLYNNVQRLKLPVNRIAPIHGQVVPWSEFTTYIGRSGDTVERCKRAVVTARRASLSGRFSETRTSPGGPERGLHVREVELASRPVQPRERPFERKPDSADIAISFRSRPASAPCQSPTACSESSESADLTHGRSPDLTKDPLAPYHWTR